MTLDSEDDGKCLTIAKSRFLALASKPGSSLALLALGNHRQEEDSDGGDAIGP